jgi:hypothetical protein
MSQRSKDQAPDKKEDKGTIVYVDVNGKKHAVKFRSYDVTINEPEKGLRGVEITSAHVQYKPPRGGVTVSAINPKHYGGHIIAASQIDRHISAETNAVAEFDSAVPPEKIAEFLSILAEEVEAQSGVIILRPMATTDGV